MLPVLARIPLPHWVLSPSLPLAALAVALGIFGVIAKLRGSRERMWRAIAVASGAAALAVLSRGRTLTIDDLTLHSYGVLLGLVSIAGWLSCRRLAERERVSPELAAHCYVVSAFGGLFGARFFYVLSHPHEFRSAFAALALWEGGLDGYGGLLCGLATLFALCKGLSLSWWTWADLLAPRLLLGLAMMRVGGYLFGSGYGNRLAESAPSWLKALGSFPRWPRESELGAGSPAWLDQVRFAGLSPDAVVSLPVHPTQLYESALALALCGFAIWLGKYRHKPGEVFLATAVVHGAGSFLIELTRRSAGTDSSHALRFLSVGQLMSLGVLFWAAINWRRDRHQTPLRAR
jgi:phosphatidylglycerol:prolipoprotein diacylglycerol transferase